MAIKTYYYKASGNASIALPALLAIGAAPVVTLPTLDNPFLAVTVDSSHKADLDAAMSDLGFAFVAEGVGKEKSITNADSPYTPGEELILLVDATAGPVSVTVPALATFAIATRQIKVVKTDVSVNAVTFVPNGVELVNGLASYSLANQYESAEFVSGPVQWHLLIQPAAGAIAPSLPVTTTSALLAGDLVAFDNIVPSQTLLADPDISLVPVRYDARGVAVALAGAGTPTRVYTVPGQRVPVRFNVAPGLADNGKRVYLSSIAGKATLTPPVPPPGSTYALVQVGILVGANGTTTPDVLFQFNIISIIPG